MTAHKHAKILKAKADNMELVVFHNAKIPDEWSENVESLFPAFREDWDYFLCLPKHKKVCLDWLNGKEYLVNQLPQEDILSVEETMRRGGWVKDHWFMSDVFTFRIKPRKEKRFIGVHKDSIHPTPLFKEKSLCEEYVLTNSISDGTSVCEWQFIEIEVEV